MRLDMADEHKLKRVTATVFRQQVLKLRIADEEPNRFKTAGINGVTLWVPRCKAHGEVATRFVDHDAHRADIEIEREKMPEDYTPIIDAVHTALEQHNF